MNDAKTVQVVGFCSESNHQVRNHKDDATVPDTRGLTDRMAEEISEFKDSLFRVESDISALKKIRKNLRREVKIRQDELRAYLHLDY